MKLTVVLACAACFGSASGFTPNSHGDISPRSWVSSIKYRQPDTKRDQCILRMARYGPPEGMNKGLLQDLDEEEWNKKYDARLEKATKDFHELFQQVLTCQNPEHLPSIMTRKLDVFASLSGYDGVRILKNIMAEAEATGDEQMIERVNEAAGFIVDFMEEFVDRTVSLDDTNKRLLGKIVNTINGKEGEGKSREEAIDTMFHKEKHLFTPGFVRHLENECQRIQSAPRMTVESSKLLQILRVILTRVLEEVGKDLGEGAIVLNQLLAYDDHSERLAVLDAALTVRGVSFGSELLALTEEALEGFKKVPGGQVDPELVERVQGIDKHLRAFVVVGEHEPWS